MYIQLLDRYLYRNYVSKRFVKHMAKKQKKEFVIIQMVVEMKGGKIEENMHIIQKSDNLSQEFKKRLEDDYAIDRKEL